MRKKLFIVTLEQLEKRYTQQWYFYLRDEFKKYYDVHYINGNMDNKLEIKKGRFLDINQTNKWKAEQVIRISELFNEEKITKDDIFLFMDGWHFGITATKYMSQLNDIPIKIYAYWHAGTWDDNDFITQAGFRDWAPNIEIGWLNALDGSFVATKYHKKLMTEYFREYANPNKIYVVGFPMDWKKVLKANNMEVTTNRDLKDEKLVVFPHRLDKEKNPGCINYLKRNLPKDYKIETTLDKNLSKYNYYKFLRKAKVSYSASHQETFGIGTVEAMLLGAVPIVPDRLAYRELYNRSFRYLDKEEGRQKIEYVMNKYGISKVLMDNLKQNQEKIIKQSSEAIPKMVKVMGE